jgi:glucose/arabinose dehydrogenase
MRHIPAAVISIAIATNFGLSVWGQALPYAGAPPKGSGSFNVTGRVRVIAGDTLDLTINGRRAAVGFLGVKAPEANTVCGKQAIEATSILIKSGVRLDEDLSYDFDRRKRRMYYLRSRKDNHSILVDLVKTGYLQADSLAEQGVAFAGAEDASLRGAQQDASKSSRGCIWGGAQQGPKNDPVLLRAAGLTRADLERPKPQAQAPPADSPLQSMSLSRQVVTPLGFGIQTLASGLTNPTAFGFLPDGRILIALKHGIVQVYKPGTGLLPTPFIDISAWVNDFWDHGLLGIAVDPNFATNGYVYLLYTYENNATDYGGPKTARLTRVTAAGDTASTATATTILGTSVGAGCSVFAAGADCIPSENSSHSIGSVHFASDGTLYVTTGDGASFNLVDDLALRSQDLDSLSGKLLHITTTGLGIATNPYWNGTATANRSKVWNYGLRNGFRFNIRPSNGSVYIGDVGWDTWEKLQLGTKGANQGWPCYEGGVQQPGYAPKALCQALYTANTANAPLYAWAHVNAQGQTISTAAIGGTFYTGTIFPTQYQGAYFYGDYGQSVIRYVTVDATDKLSGTPADFASNADGPVDFAMGADGNLYYLAINAGELRIVTYGVVTLTPPPSGTTYVSDLTWTASTNGWGPVEKDMSNGEQAAGDGKTISIRGTTYPKGLGTHAASDVSYYLGGNCSLFNATVGIDDEILAAYQSVSSAVFQVWGDGTKLYDSGTVGYATAAIPVTVNIAGKTQLDLVVTDAGDGNGADHADWATARVTCGSTNPKPTAAIATPLPTLSYKVGDTVGFSGSAADGSGGTVPAAGLVWTIIIHHCPGGLCHTHTLLSVTGASGSFVVPDHGDDSYFEISLTATNTYGQIDTKSVSISPLKVPLTLTTSPTGLQLVYGGTTVTSPFTVQTVIGSAHTLTATTPQSGTCVFASWSDAGAAQHNITIGSAAATYTATYTGCPAPVTKYASDLTWTSAANGWGPVEKDMSNGEQAAGDGHPLTLRGVTYAKGLGTHAASSVVYTMANIGSCTSFTSDVGVDDETNGSGSVIFQLFGDGTKLYDSGTMTGTTAAKSATVGLAGVSLLTLTVTDNGNGNAGDHADWAGARFTCAAGTPPTISAVQTASITTSGATISWTTNVAADTQVQYGTTTSYGSSTTLAAAMVTSHSQTLTGLTTGTLYHYRVKSKDAAANLATSAGFTFTTAADTTPPAVATVVPASGATSISIATAVTATFSEAIAPATLTTTTFTLVASGSSTPVTATVTYNPAALTATLTPSASLTTGKLYTATIKGGTGGVADLAGNLLAANKVWTFTTASSTPTTKYLSNLTWTSMTNGWGSAEKDMSNGGKATGDGKTITIRGTTYSKGLGVNAASNIQYSLTAAGVCSAMLATVGVDDETNSAGSLVFQVWTDGTKLFDSGTVTGTSAAQAVNVNVTGKSVLTLIVTDAGDGNASDHGDWANARLTCQ